MERHFLGRTIRLVFWVALTILLLAPSSFGQAPGVQDTPLSIDKIEMTEIPGNGFRVAIDGSKPFEYTAYKLDNPLRIVVSMPQARMGKLEGLIAVNNGIINIIRAQYSDDPQKKGTQVEIGLDQLVEYNITSEGNRLYVDLGKAVVARPPEIKVAPAKPPEGKVAETKVKAVKPERPLPRAKAIREVAVTAQPDGVKVNIKADGALPDYKSLQLGKPTRLVVDLPKISNASSKKNISVGNPLLKDIRIGQNKERLRLVFTFPGTQLPIYRMAREGNELHLLLGRAQEVVGVKEEKSAPPAAKEERVAEVQPKAPEQATPVAEKPEGAPKEVAVEGPKVATEQVPAAQASVVEKDLAADVKRGMPTQYKGSKISLDFKDADLHNIFRLIADVSNLNIIAGEDVKGKITLRLVNVPWDQALEVILSTKNLIKIEEGNVVRITTLETVRKEREEKLKEDETLVKNRDTRQKLEEPGRKIIKINYGEATEIQKLLLERKEEGKGFLSPQGSVKADKRTNTLIIQDIRANLEEIEQLVKDLDSPTPQVLIEARVVQASTNFTRSLGVQWGGGYNQTAGQNWFYGLTGNNPSAAPGWGFTPSATPGASTPLIAPSNFVVNFPAAATNTPVGGMGISLGKLTGSLVNLDLRLQLGETDGQTKVIARPKLATLDNKEAHIKQGEKIPYETTSQAGTQVQFIDAVLQLKVTPHVTPDGSILMKVFVTRDARGDFRSAINQVPSITNREAQTEVLVKDGETLVIGGIYEIENAQTEQGLPWLMRIPILGWLFKNQETRSVRNELLIFITPTILHLKTGT